jgi:hypothetical protein
MNLEIFKKKKLFFLLKKLFFRLFFMSLAKMSNFQLTTKLTLEQL